MASSDTEVESGIEERALAQQANHESAPELKGSDKHGSLNDMRKLGQQNQYDSDSEASEAASDLSANTFNDGGMSLWNQFGQMFWSQPPMRKCSFATGLDYWVPEDCEKVVAFPTDAIEQYTKIYPIRGSDATKHSSFSVLVDASPFSRARDKQPLHHLVLTIHPNAGPSMENREFSISLFRSRKVTDVVALCERCRECRALFRYFPKGKDNTIFYYVKLLGYLQVKMLWKVEHIGALVGCKEFFENQPSKKLKKNLSAHCSPEGLTPLMIAIQQNDEDMVSLLIQKGADLMQTTPEANNVLHLAATVSPSMLNILWDALGDNKTVLLGHVNHDGSSPQYLAFTSMNARCLSTLRGFAKQVNPEATPENPLIQAMKSPKTTFQHIDAILKETPDAIDKTDPVTGNSVLHICTHKKPLSALIEVLGEKLPVNARNSLNQTPLHVYVHKDNLALVFTILGAEVDINAQDDDGNTALHLATSLLNVTMVRTLLCFGANPNIHNLHDESPRHLAAKHRDEAGSIDILRSLIMFGAKSCGIKKLGCTVACVHKDNYISEKTSPVSKENNNQNTSSNSLASLASTNGNEKPKNDKDNVESDVDSARINNAAATEAYEFELDADTHDVKNAYVEPNPPRKFPQDAAVRRIKALLTQLADKENSNIISVLSCDGGGMKGIIMVQMLIILQRYLDAPVHTYFDWVAGTSTGSYVSGALAKGFSLAHMQRYYLRTKDILFTTWSRPYNTLRFEALCRDALGDDRLSKVPYPKLVFTTTRADTFPCQLVLQRNYQLPIPYNDNLDLGFDDPEDTPLWLAARRSAAAPTYFAASEGKFIDGGMVANNPSLDLLSEVIFWNTTCRMQAPEEAQAQPKFQAANEVRIGCFLSLGTGITPVSPVDPSLFEMSDTLGMLRGIKNLTLMVLDQATATEGAPISRSRSWCHSLRIPYFRLNAPLFKDVMLDASDDSEIAQMLWDCEVYGYTHKKDFIELASLLKAIGTNKHRKQRFGSAKASDYSEGRKKRLAEERKAKKEEQEQPAVSPDSPLNSPDARNSSA
ncbi:unnamed protein product, partial [Mesorhabditis spiculigera]